MKLRYLWITASIFLLDHLSKWIVRNRMELDDAIVIVPGFLNLSYVRNSGVAFGLFADIQSAWKPYVLAGMAVVAVIVILMYASRMPTNRMLLQIALAVTLGGILGNFIDRIAHGFVVDFIEFHIRNSFQSRPRLQSSMNSGKYLSGFRDNARRNFRVIRHVLNQQAGATALRF